MPAEDRVDRTTPNATMPNATMLDAVAARLARTSTAALDASHELLAHYADTGDVPTQRAVDTLIDHAADALRALTDSLADTSRGLEGAALRCVEASRPAARPGRRRDHFA